jgi:hypothetical protein
MLALQLRRWRALRSGVTHPGSHGQEMVNVVFEPGGIIHPLAAFLEEFDSKSNLYSIYLLFLFFFLCKCYFLEQSWCEG